MPLHGAFLVSLETGICEDIFRAFQMSGKHNHYTIFFYMIIEDFKLNFGEKESLKDKVSDSQLFDNLALYPQYFWHH